MKPSWILSSVLLASVTAFSVAALPLPVLAGPPHCPPGLAKKGSCSPPGQRRHWARGDHIPPDVAYRRVHPGDYGLPPPGHGRFYADIGGDIYLLAEATQRVIEALNLYDAATRR